MLHAMKENHLSEILMHLGEERAEYFNAVAPPIIQTSNFAYPSLDDFRAAFSNELNSHLYTRGNNPTVSILRKKLAALEQTEDALVFGSGMGAISAAIMSQVKAGGHVVCIANPYSWTYKLLNDYLPRFGVSSTFVDGQHTRQIENAIQDNTSLLYLESPNSLTLELQDIAACVAIAKRYGLTSCMDNSYASPIFQQPAKIGVDIIVHSGSKYLNGHSDVVMGVLCSTKAIIHQIFEGEYMTFGGILSPNNAALAIRGLRTLELRMQRSHTSAMKIARYLEKHDKVERVIHPFLPSYPQYQLAKQQMSGTGGLFSLYLKTDSMENIEAFIKSLHGFLLAVSWGGYESLILPSASFYNIPGKPDTTIPWNFMRVYIGLEDPDWLIEQLDIALEEL
jgi:cystathionine beta-lyase/cystathionine gamma-synthase